MRIRKVGVVGAGTMGGGIAALVASAGVPVVMLDVPGDGDRNAPARQGLERQTKAKPAAFMDPERARLVRTGNTDDDFALLAECDWIVEAIVEQPAPKQALFAELEQLLAPSTIVSSNTSGIPICVLTEGRTAHFKRRFLGTHFFSPVRYMHLLELIPTADTAPETLSRLWRLLDATRRAGDVRQRLVEAAAQRAGLRQTLAARWSDWAAWRSRRRLRTKRQTPAARW